MTITAEYHPSDALEMMCICVLSSEGHSMTLHGPTITQKYLQIMETVPFVTKWLPLTIS